MGYRQRIGMQGERFAAHILEENGFRILCRNFRCRMGELDIIAAKEERIHFIEVKTRMGSGAGHPAEAVTEEKQTAIRRAASYYAMIKGLRDREFSFDVIEVELNYLENCF